MRGLLPDLVYAVRQLRKNRGVTGLVILTLALGIGANTAIFSVVNGFSRPLPVASPEQIVVVAAQVKGDRTGFQYRHSYPALVDLRGQSEVFSDVLGYDMQLGGLTAGRKTSQFMYAIVTGNYFSVLGIRPAAGRLFVPGEGEHPDARTLVVLGYSCWQKRFGGDPGVVGSQVRVDGKPATVIGVVPREFHGLYVGGEMDAYLPLSYLTAWEERNFADLFTNRNKRRLTVVARLKPGVSVSRARSAMNVIAARLADLYPASDKNVGIRVVPETLARPMPLPQMADFGPMLTRLFLVLAGLVLLVACLNVANILLVDAALRRREMAVRAALGSGRGRLMRQMLTQSMLLALLGAAAGTVVASWASHALSSLHWLETDLPVSLDFSFDWRVFAYSLGAAIATGIVMGLWPAFHAARADLNAVLHDGSRSSGGPARQRARGLLVVAQVSGSLILLIAAGLFVRQLREVGRVDLGFDADHILNVLLDPHYVGYSRTRATGFFRELERRVTALPGVESASEAFSVPLGYWQDGSVVRVEGRAYDPGEQPPMVFENPVDPPYFDTLRIPIRRGRGFRESDDENAPRVAVVNETMAREFWPNQDPIGKRFSRDGGRDWWQVAGVARDSKYLVVFERPLPYFYVPLAQDYASMRVLQVRSTERPETLAAEVERAIHALDPDMPVSDVRTMRQSLAGGMGFMMFRFGASLAGIMGLLGLILAAVGIYGVVSFSASQRTREIGIRMALGAERSSILRLVLRQAITLVLLGVAAGLAGAAALARVMANYMAFVSAADPLAFTLLTLLLAAVALCACYIPARKAMRMDPMAALRHE
jgi:predicted permease